MLSGYINKVREEEKNVIYAIAGDMFRGSVIDSEYKGISTIEIMNMLHPDVVTLGNHETDYGIGQLLFLEKCARFPIVNANLHIKTNEARLFKPCEIINIDGMKIMFIGILTEEVISQTKNDGLIGALVDVENAVQEITRICNAYNAIDIDFTVLLTHIGFEEDKKLAAMLDPALGVDVIIGGHSHTLLEKPEVVNGIPIVQAGTGTDQIGRFDIMIDTDNNCIDSYTWQIIPIDSSHCPVDENIKKIILSYKGKTDVKYQRVITRFKRKLTHPMRQQETELGDLMADILRDSLGVDIALLGAGSISGKELGPVVLYQDLVELIPYNGAIYSGEVTGDEFMRMIRYMLRDEVWQGAPCEFYQLSRDLEITYDAATHEFLKFNYRGKPMERDHLYTIVLQQYHYMNFEKSFNIPMDEIAARKKPRVVATSERDIIVEYLETHQMLDQEVEGRLTVLNAVPME